MVHAKLHDFVVLTHDLDFSAILAATNADKPSVVQIRAVNLTPEALVGPVTMGLRRCDRALANGALLTIDAVRLRLRLLPLKTA
jgi:predicted nuclease of predicted toxin-antitoxin system